MHRVFQSFINGRINSADSTDLRNVLTEAGSALDLSCFAYRRFRTPAFNRSTCLHPVGPRRERVGLGRRGFTAGRVADGADLLDRPAPDATLPVQPQDAPKGGRSTPSRTPA